MFRFIWENYEALELDPDAYTYVPSVRRCSRVAADGFPVRETVAEYVQIVRTKVGALSSMGVRVPRGIPADLPVQLYGGGTLVFDEYGRMRFQIASNVFSKKQSARLEYLWEIGHFSERRFMVRRFAELHRERAMRSPRNLQERW